MDNKTKGIVATIAAVVLCGCPGLFLCLFGVITAFGGGKFNLGDQAGNIPTTYGYVFMCLALIFILIPILVGFFTLRNKSATPAAPSNNEPPAASL